MLQFQAPPVKRLVLSLFLQHDCILRYFFHLTLLVLDSIAFRIKWEIFQHEILLFVMKENLLLIVVDSRVSFTRSVNWINRNDIEARFEIQFLLICDEVLDLFSSTSLLWPRENIKFNLEERMRNIRFHFFFLLPSSASIQQMSYDMMQRGNFSQYSRSLLWLMKEKNVHILFLNNRQTLFDKTLAHNSIIAYSWKQHATYSGLAGVLNLLRLFN